MDQAFDYHDTVVHSDINRADHVRKKPERVKRPMRSYARNQGAQTPNTVLVQDISVNGEASMDAETVASYLNVLRKIFVVEDMPAGNPNMRSKTAIRSSDTRYYVDPSIAATALESGPQDLLADLRTFGFLFETLRIRDLRIFVDVLGGEKLIEEGSAHLRTLSAKIVTSKTKAPAFLMVLTGSEDYAYRRADGVYVIPIGCLKD